MCRGNSFFLIIKEINILLKNDGDNPTLLRRHIKKTRVHFYRLFHHEANAYNADRPNNEIHENWCWTKTGWTPLMASILFLGCRIYGCLGFFCGVVSISTLALMSFSRYIHVCKSSKCKGFFLIFRSDLCHAFSFTCDGKFYIFYMQMLVLILKHFFSSIFL